MKIIDEFIPLHYETERSNFIGRDLEKFAEWCVKHDTSDITLQNEEKIVCEIHGNKHLVTTRRLNKADLSSILTYIHSPGLEATLNTGEDVNFSWTAKIDKNKHFRFRVNAKSIQINSERGYSITMRYIKSEAPHLKSLNLPSPMIDTFYNKRGIIIVSGPTNSGKSTLLASVIQFRVSEKNSHIKVSTFEDPIEFVHDVEKFTSSISQCEIGINIPSFSRGVKNSLRTRSDIVFIGETKDRETIEAVIESAMTASLVYTTCHTNNVAEVPARLLTLIPENEKESGFMNLIDNLDMIITQKLIPSINNKRIAIREYVILTQAFKDILIEGGIPRITYNLRKIVKEHGQTFLQDLTEKFIEGLISEEVFYDIKKELK